jgi:chemotaxis protein histidine kinase CheA
MNLDPAPRLNKLVFFAIDAALLIIAVLIVVFARDPYAPLPFVTAVACVLVAAIVGIAPLIIDFIAENRDFVREERHRVTEQVQRLHTAGESLARAAAQIKAVEEAVHKTAHAAENLPYRMQEKLAEFNEALTEKDTEEREALERELDELRAANATALKAVAEKITKATTEWTALEANTRKQLASAQETSAKLDGQLQSVLAQLDSRIAVLANAAATVPAVRNVPSFQETPPAPAAPAAPAREASGPVPAPALENPAPVRAEPEERGVIESVTFATVTTGEESKPKRPRAARKPRPEDTLAAMSAEPTMIEPENSSSDSAAIVGDEPVSTTEEPAAKSESSASSDGATRLLVTAYIGIGNKLFIRGEGPGLSWDKGTPMQFVSIGKWGWASHEATAPVRCKLYKNDDTAALSGEVTLEPGKHVEVTALF